LRAGTTLIARGEFSLIIIGLVGSSIAGVAALATSYVFVMAIVGPVLARLTGGSRPATMRAVQRPGEGEPPAGGGEPGNRQ
jgi:CPA2 family monovalent cation:H+ antiporter-2